MSSLLYVFPTMTPFSPKLKEAYEVKEDFCTEYQGKLIWVPKFFQFDGASIPWPAYNLVGTPFNPKHMTAAVVHDWLYYSHEIERKHADRLFYQMLRDAGVGKVRAVLMRETVEAMGRFYWANDDKDKAFLEKLRQKIVDDGRDPLKYGLKDE